MHWHQRPKVHLSVHCMPLYYWIMFVYIAMLCLSSAGSERLQVQRLGKRWWEAKWYYQEVLVEGLMVQ